MIAQNCLAVKIVRYTYLAKVVNYIKKCSLLTDIYSMGKFLQFIALHVAILNCNKSAAGLLDFNTFMKHTEVKMHSRKINPKFCSKFVAVCRLAYRLQFTVL